MRAVCVLLTAVCALSASARNVDDEAHRNALDRTERQEAAKLLRFARARVGAAAFPPSDYNIHQRPNRSEAVVVETGPRILNIFGFDDAGGTVHMDLFLRFSWRDARLTFDPADAGGRTVRRVPNDSIWRPRGQVVNSQGPGKMVSEDATVTESGVVVVNQRLEIIITHTFDMTHFPWDVHRVSIVVGTMKYDSNQVTFVPEEAAARINYDNVQGSVFLLSNFTLEAREEASLIANRDSRLIASFTASRIVKASVLQLVLPMALIALFALSVGPIALDRFDARAGIAGTSMLTISAFMYVVNERLPSIAYLSWIHYYTFLTFFIVFMVVVQVFVVHVIDPNATGRSDGFEDSDVEGDWDKISKSFEALLAFKKAHAVNTVLTRINMSLFVISNFILFIMERPVPTIVVTIAVIILFFSSAMLYKLTVQLFFPQLDRDDPRDQAKVAKLVLDAKKTKSMMDIVRASTLGEEGARFDRMTPEEQRRYKLRSKTLRGLRQWAKTARKPGSSKKSSLSAPSDDEAKEDTPLL